MEGGEENKEGNCGGCEWLIFWGLCIVLALVIVIIVIISISVNNDR